MNIEKLKNEIKKLEQQARGFLKNLDIEKLNAINKKIFAMREIIRAEKRAEWLKNLEKRTHNAICEKLSKEA